MIADRVAVPVDHVFAHPALFSGAMLWLAVIGYSIQIYCDFSGYSDMAIGTAKMIGYDLPENFNMPYAADERHRVLAPLAHDAQRVAARLPLHPARRQPKRRRRAPTSTSC